MCYALVNLSEATGTVQLQALRHGVIARQARVPQITADGRRLRHKSIDLLAQVSIELKPWEICCLEQTRLE